ncbi:MAG: glycoside hydrolase family 9 protein, partial [Oscillospiraceae bacterium]|nr:glycoside hydrolase family 9 protein [Oscillospiraceae bacterium]
RDWYIFRYNLEFWSGCSETIDSSKWGYEPVHGHKRFGLDDELWNKKITAEEIKDLPDAQGAYLAKTPAGFGMLNEYGSCRYNTAAQLCALVYAKETGDDVFVDWCAGQMGYICGNNPMGRAYIVGYDLKDGACHPHHRASHGSTTQNMDDPVDQTHVLWGALVGGPDKTDWHRDITKDYVYNEVAVDYNAGFVGACAGLYKYIGKERGDEPEENFPPSEQELNGGEPITEFTLKAAVGREDDDSTQVLIEIDNHTSLPPRYLDGIDVRFYFNISEMLEAGYTFDDFMFSPQYDSLSSNTNGESEVTYEVEMYNDKGDCYVNLHWPKAKFYGKEQYQFALVNAAYVKIWDSSNDYSTGNIPKAEDLGLEIGKAPQFTNYCTMYVDGKQVWGKAPDDAPQPDYIAPDATQPATKALTTGVKYGDVNCDKVVDIMDVIAMNKHLLGVAKLEDKGLANADVDGNDKVDSSDSLYILKAVTGSCTLPVKP